MGKYTFKLGREVPHDKTIGKFEAWIPRTDATSAHVDRENFPKFIRISNGSVSGVFKTNTAEIIDEEIIIHPEALNGISDDEIIEYGEVSKNEFTAYRIVNDKSLTYLTYGFGIAVLGLILDFYFTLARYNSALVTSLCDCTVITLVTISTILKIIGLALVYFNGVKEKK